MRMTLNGTSTCPWLSSFTPFYSRTTYYKLPKLKKKTICMPLYVCASVLLNKNYYYYYNNKCTNRLSRSVAYSVYGLSFFFFFLLLLLRQSSNTNSNKNSHKNTVYTLKTTMINSICSSTYVVCRFSSLHTPRRL